MKTPMKNKSPVIEIINDSLVDLPTPSNISYFWNFGSLLGLALIIQIVTGLFLSMHYCASVENAFNSVIHISRDVNSGWMMRNLHANGASLFFICIYAHIGRGMYYGSFKLTETWTVGVIILLVTMATAFLGYVLPWGQMSFWGATVITNLLSAIPYLGTTIVQWVWGGFAVDNATLNRFFSLHFLLPFVIAAMVMIHLLFLHQTGSSNPLGTNSNLDKIPFHPFFSSKDILGFIITILALNFIATIEPFMLSDPDNFTPANPMVTPVHIQPEWYFLFAYAILRSIPNKLGGVVALAMSIIILLVMPLTEKKFSSSAFYPINKILFWLFTMNFILLTWLGAQPIEEPFVIMSKTLTVTYFSFFFINPALFKIWDKMN